MKKMFSLFGLTVLAGGMAMATNSTANMAVSASVSNNCTISAGSLAFGAYDPIVTNAATALPGTATLSVTCTNGASTVITLGQGTNAGGASTDAAPVRRLKGDLGADSVKNFLNYSLTQDGGGSTTWGNTAGTGASYTGSGSTESVTVFGSIAGAQTPIPLSRR
jgi:spore coat protein U-like protein